MVLQTAASWPQLADGICIQLDSAHGLGFGQSRKLQRLTHAAKAIAIIHFCQITTKLLIQWSEIQRNPENFCMQQSVAEQAYLQVASVVGRGVRESGEEGDDKGCSGLGAGAEGGRPPSHEEEPQGQAGAHVGAVVVLAGLTHHHHWGWAL